MDELDSRGGDLRARWRCRSEPKGGVRGARHSSPHVERLALEATCSVERLEKDLRKLTF